MSNKQGMGGGQLVRYGQWSK